MRLRQLECFRALIVHGTMTRVADLLGMSQPGVSTTIAALEHAFGLQLFIRQGSRLRPTPEALLLYSEANRALDAVENTARLASDIRAGRCGQLSIIAYPNISIDFLPRLTSGFTTDRPDLLIKINTRQSQIIEDAIAAQTFDIAITELPISYPASHMEVFTYECMCMLPQGHVLAERDVITPTELDGIPFVSLVRGDFQHEKLAAAFSDKTSHWNVVVETEFRATSCALVEAGRGVGLIDPVISGAFTRNVVLRPFRPTILYQIAILHPLKRELSQVARQFSNLVSRHLAS